MKAGSGKPDDESALAETMRLDRLLVYLRFARTRSTACAMIEGRALRLNRKHVQRVSENVSIGDVITLMFGDEVHVIEILALPERRASAALAKSYYRELGRELGPQATPQT